MVNLVPAGLIVSQALLLTATAAWFFTLRHGDGVLRACLNCLGEGWFEFVLFAAAWAVVTLALAQVLLQERKEAA